MNNPKVICIGEALVDRIGAPGANLILDNGIDDCLGGAPANVACGLSKLGVDVAFVGGLGNDSIGKEFCDLFISRGVNISGLQISKDLPTRIVLVYRDVKGERSFGGFIGGAKNLFADQELDLDKIKLIWPSFSKNASCLLLGTILLASESSRKVVSWAIENAKINKMNIVIDLNWRPTFWDSSLDAESPPSEKICSLIKSFLEQATFLKLAKEEAIWFFKTSDPKEISKSLSNKPSVIVTDGAQPIKWSLGKFSGQTEAISPPLVVDTTGAGDSFTDGIISQLLAYSFDPKSKIDAEQILLYSAACGALVCGGKGAIDPQPSCSEVHTFLESLEEDISSTSLPSFDK